MNQDAASQPSQKSKLAIYGGPPAVPRRYSDRWRAIRLPEIIKVAGYALRQQATHFGGGGEIAKFEQAFMELTHTKFAVSMNSGTAAIHSALMACGVGIGDEVIVPSYTFFASVAPILQCGAVPVFCDIDPRTLTACAADVEQRITERTKAIIVVHVWGNPARLDRLTHIAQRHRLRLIEDCSHAHGASFDSRPVGSWGDIGCFSLQGSKPVSGGEAGIAVTNDDLLFDRMLALGHYGRSSSEQVTGTLKLNNLSLGVKYRPHLYAIILASAALSRLQTLNELRRKNYAILADTLAGCPGIQAIDCYQAGQRGGLLEFMLRVSPEHIGWNRGAFVNAVRAEGVRISCDRYRPQHLEPLFREMLPTGFGGALQYHPWVKAAPPRVELPHTHRVSRELVALPPLTQLPENTIRKIGQALRKVASLAPQISDLRSGQTRLAEQAVAAF